MDLHSRRYTTLECLIEELQTIEDLCWLTDNVFNTMAFRLPRLASTTSTSAPPPVVILGPMVDVKNRTPVLQHKMVQVLAHTESVIFPSFDRARNHWRLFVG